MAQGGNPGHGWENYQSGNRDAARRHRLAGAGYVYLLFALDLWFEKRVKAHCRGKAFILRAVAPDKTAMLRISRFHPGVQRRIAFLGFETYWMQEKDGSLIVKIRTVRKKLQAGCRRIKEWIKANRPLKGAEFIQALNRKLQGHYNYYNVPGNLESLWHFYHWAVKCSFKWLNRRGGKRKSFSWQVFSNAIERLRIAKPKQVMVNRRHRVFA